MRELFAAFLCLALACEPDAIATPTQPTSATPGLAAVPVAAFVAPVAAVVATPDAAGADASASGCGKRLLPDCPLQGWMKRHLTDAANTPDFDALNQRLTQLASNAPKQVGYPNWVSIANDSARAARSADLAAVQAGCRSCHAQYKSKYRAELRDRPAPLP